MGLKELIESIMGKPNPKEEKNNSDIDNEEKDNIEVEQETIALNDKVNDFIGWYYENFVKGFYTDIGEYHVPKEMLNLIEKMAVWYELRYPDYEINRLMPGSNQEPTKVNDTMFRNNPYINILLDSNSEIKDLDWDEFYNATAFFESLPAEEQMFFRKPRYRSIVYLNPNKRIFGHLHLSEDGVVEMAEDINWSTNGKVQNDELEGLTAEEALDYLKEQGIDLPQNNELEQAIKNVELFNLLREKILNCVMYRIIERGGNRIGPRRGFLFAKEFKRDIDIPMKYGVDTSDPGLGLFIYEYIRAGGRKDLECYVNYFSHIDETKPIDTTTVKDLILRRKDDSLCFYTDEEIALYQNLANVIARVRDEKEKQESSPKKLILQKEKQSSN